MLDGELDPFMAASLAQGRRWRNGRRRRPGISRKARVFTRAFGNRWNRYQLFSGVKLAAGLRRSARHVVGAVRRGARAAAIGPATAGLRSNASVLRRAALRRWLGAIGQRIVGVAAIAFEERAGFDRKRFVQDVAFDVAGGAELNLARANTALDVAAHGRIFGIDVAFDGGLLADHQRAGADVAFDAAVDLNVARGHQRAFDDQIGADDRGNGASAPMRLAALRLLLLRRSRFGFFTPVRT